MLTLDVTSEQVETAKRWYGFGVLNNSIAEECTSVYDALGEVMFAHAYEGEWIRSHARDFDFSSVEGLLTTDVKTRRTAAVPQLDWNCTVAESSITQKCDYYYFVRVTECFSKAFLLGYLGKDEFFEVAKFYRKGTPDPDRPSWNFQANCFNVTVEQLIPPSPM